MSGLWRIASTAKERIDRHTAKIDLLQKHLDTDSNPDSIRSEIKMYEGFRKAAEVDLQKEQSPHFQSDTRLLLTGNPPPQDLKAQSDDDTTNLNN